MYEVFEFYDRLKDMSAWPTTSYCLMVVIGSKSDKGQDNITFLCRLAGINNSFSSTLMLS